MDEVKSFDMGVAGVDPVGHPRNRFRSLDGDQLPRNRGALPGVDPGLCRQPDDVRASHRLAAQQWIRFRLRRSGVEREKRRSAATAQGGTADFRRWVHLGLSARLALAEDAEDSVCYLGRDKLAGKCRVCRLRW